MERLGDLLYVVHPGMEIALRSFILILIILSSQPREFLLGSQGIPSSWKGFHFQ